MSPGSSSYLNELTLWKLKIVAEEYGIDVSNLKHKRDFIDRISSKNLTEDQVRLALEKARLKSEASPEEGPRDEKAIITELEEIAEKPEGSPDLPKKDQVTVERNIDQALLMRPSFFEVDSANESAWSKMILGDFNEAMKLNHEARIKVLASFSAFQVYSAAVSIRAAETLLSNLADEKGPLDSNLKTALAEAKRAFIGGNPRSREETLNELEVLAAGAYKAFMEKSEKAEADLYALLSDYEGFGTRTQESRRLMEIAGQAKRVFNMAEYSRLVNQSREEAEKAKEARAGELGRQLKVVSAAVEEAKEVGVDTSAKEQELREATEAYQGSSFSKAMQLMTAVERAVDTDHLDKLRNKEVEQRQVEKVNATIVTYAPDLQEAAYYGMDVQEGLLFVNNTKAALSNKDIVAAAKFARRVKEIVQPMQKDIDHMRMEKGVIKHVEEARCGKCGKESLYVYPNNTQKCMECGHSFSLVAPPTLETLAEAEAAPSKSNADTAGTGTATQAPGGDDKPSERRIQTRTLKGQKKS